MSASSSLDSRYVAVKSTIQKLLSKPSYDDGSLGPLFVRLSWHASGTFDGRSLLFGGSDGGRIRYSPESSDPANAGLQDAIKFLEPVKKLFDWISYADLYTLAGVAAIEAMGGPIVPWRPGRKDLTEAQVKAAPIPNGRLPDGAKGADHVREVFYRMGFNDRDIVALSGAHSLGRCHKDRSGFEGPWTYSPTRFSNQYYILLNKLEWTPRKWDGPLQYASPDGELMMLPSDVALIKDPKMKPYVLEYSENKDKFYQDFASAFGRLLELGVKRQDSKPVQTLPKSAL